MNESMNKVASPLKDIPSCWENDDKRMDSLFAPFRKRELNPVGWDSKMKFWQNVLEKWCIEHNQAIFSVTKMQQEFKRKDKSPLCLETVVNELIRSGEIKKKTDFISTVPFQTWTGWAVNSFVKVPLSWSYTKFVGSLIAPDESEVEYVNMNFLKERGELLISKTDRKKEDIISCEEAKTILSEGLPPMSVETLNLVLHWIQLERKAVIETVDGKKLIKFFRSHSKSPEPILSEADRAIFKLQQSKLVLSKNLEDLEIEKEKVISEAKSYLQKGLRQSAKNCVKKKKELEKCIEKRSSTLDNLESLLSRLRDTESDSKVIEAYKVGLAAMKNSFKSAGLSEDGVFETLSQLQEMNEIQDEIQAAISLPVNNDVDEDLEEELASILKSGDTDTSIDLPNVPSHDIKSPDTLEKRLQALRSS